jgi:hypothetical protein
MPEARDGAIPRAGVRSRSADQSIKMPSDANAAQAVTFQAWLLVATMNTVPILCTTFRKEAGITWNRMKKAAMLGMSLSEETLTECALYDIAVTHTGTEFVIKVAKKHEEKRHGADWEWWLVCGNKGLGFRVQAKRLFPGGRYESLFKSGKTRFEQLDKLIRVSKKEGCIPLYCFFNFDTGKGQIAGSKNSCPHWYYGPSFWGCSLASPIAVKNANSDQFTRLKRLMYPWHLLVCQSATADVVNAAMSFLQDSDWLDE